MLLVDLSLILVIVLILALTVGPLALIIYFIYKASKGKNIFMTWTCLTLILCILSLPYGVASAISELVTYMISKDRINNAKQEKTKSHEPNPGSDADYERWKQERQNQGGNT